MIISHFSLSLSFPDSGDDCGELPQLRPLVHPRLRGESAERLRGEDALQHHVRLALHGAVRRVPQTCNAINYSWQELRELSVCIIGETQL